MFSSNLVLLLHFLEKWPLPSLGQSGRSIQYINRKNMWFMSFCHGSCSFISFCSIMFLHHKNKTNKFHLQHKKHSRPSKLAYYRLKHCSYIYYWGKAKTKYILKCCPSFSATLMTIFYDYLILNSRFVRKNYFPNIYEYCNSWCKRWVSTILQPGLLRQALVEHNNWHKMVKNRPTRGCFRHFDNKKKYL